MRDLVLRSGGRLCLKNRSCSQIPVSAHSPVVGLVDERLGGRDELLELVERLETVLRADRLLDLKDLA